MDLLIKRDTCIWEIPMRAATCVWVIPSKKRRWRMRRSRGSRRAMAGASTRLCSKIS